MGLLIFFFLRCRELDVDMDDDELLSSGQVSPLSALIHRNSTSKN
jgi:hypothetical protein